MSLDYYLMNFSDFSIESESDNYRIHIGGYSGTAGDCFTASDHSLDEMQFTTPDRDNDRYRISSCQLFGLNLTEKLSKYPCGKTTLSKSSKNNS